MSKAISVSELNNQLKGLLETTFCNVYVEGEISNLTYHNSGHIYFSIKDKDSVISCVMFKGNAKKLKFRLEIGAKIIISGSITVYTPRGNYQLLCNNIEPYGIGALSLAYEQLKAKLQIKGYFNSANKKQLPKYPKIIYVITSPTGSAIEDMKKILSNRYPLAKMVLLPTIVQGSEAKKNISLNITKADLLSNQHSVYKTYEQIIIVGRGGGSIEDLWAFNEEIVSDAIYKSQTPIISAVGHEDDFVISDFVADVRASTPSNAIEIATPHLNDLRLMCDNIYDNIALTYKNSLLSKQEIINNLLKFFKSNSIENRFLMIQNDIDRIKENIIQLFKQNINIKEQEIDLIINSFERNNPNNNYNKSYGQITKDNRLVDIDILKEGDLIELQSINNIFNCKVLKKKEIN